MPIRFLRKIKEELYKVSEPEAIDNTIENPWDINFNKDIIHFILSSRELRNKTDSEIISSFSKALKCNKIFAIKALFYVRDKVCGLGERKVFKVLIKYLAVNESNLMLENMHLISKYGRWDDYYALFYTPLENEVIKMFENQLRYDLNSEKPSLLGKWLKSENTSSKNSKKLGTRTRVLLGYTSKEYRVILSSLRKRIDIIERKMSSKDFKSIKYDYLSLDTCLRYKNSFIKNDGARYKKSIKMYKKNLANVYYKEKIGDFNQTPFNIIDLITNNIEYITNESKIIYEDIWNITCDKYKPIFEDCFVIVDSAHKGNAGYSNAYKISMSATLFYNKLNSNVYKDYYMYFDPNARFAKVREYDIFDQINSMNKMNLSNKNSIESALDLILFTSIKKELKNDKIPKSILIVCDLDLESKYKDGDEIQLIKTKWEQAGYVMPKLKFWQVDYNGLIGCVVKDSYSNVFAKGYSKELFISLLKEEVITSDELILKILQNNRYRDLNVKFKY